MSCILKRIKCCKSNSKIAKLHRLYEMGSKKVGNELNIDRLIRTVSNLKATMKIAIWNEQLLY